MSNIWATRVANQPVMVGRTDAEWLSSHLNGAAMAVVNLETRLTAEAPMMQDDFWPAKDSWLSSYRPYEVKAGTLYIPVKGYLAHEFGYAIGDWITGYTYIAKAFERGMEDPEVERIAMILATGGGEVAGNFDLVDKIYSMRGTKPIQAFVNESAYSAGYSLASAADTITMTRTAGVGSIGVVTAHVDVSERLGKDGVKITFVFAGDHKVDGNSYEALPEDVKNRMQARIDSMYDIFVSTVSRNRGLDEQAIRDTEALTYGAQDAVAARLADSVMPFEEAVAAFAGELNDQAGEFSMSTFTQEQVDAARAEGTEAGRAEGRTEGAAAERTRIKDIMASEPAANRRTLAFHLALNTAQSVEEVTGTLAMTPEEKQEATGTAFEEAMKKDNPDIQAEQEQDNVEASDEAKATAELVANFRKVTGIKKGE